MGTLTGRATAKSADQKRSHIFQKEWTKQHIGMKCWSGYYYGRFNGAQKASAGELLH